MILVVMRARYQKLMPANDIKSRFLVKPDGPFIANPGKQPHTGLALLFGQFYIEVQQLLAQFQRLVFLEQVNPIQLGCMRFGNAGMRGIRYNF